MPRLGSLSGKNKAMTPGMGIPGVIGRSKNLESPDFPELEEMAH